MRLRASYKLFEALKMKTDSCSWWPVSTVDDFFGSVECVSNAISSLLVEKLVDQIVQWDFDLICICFCIVSSFRISRFTSNSCIFGERALKDVGAHWCAQRDSYKNVFDNLLVSRIR